MFTQEDLKWGTTGPSLKSSQAGSNLTIQESMSFRNPACSLNAMAETSKATNGEEWGQVQMLMSYSTKNNSNQT